MSKVVEATQLIDELARSGYFQDNSFNPSKFIKVCEYQLNISRDKAIEQLVDGGLANLEYDKKTNMNPRDVLDSWKVTLTAKGKELLDK